MGGLGKTTLVRWYIMVLECKIILMSEHGLVSEDLNIITVTKLIIKYIAIGQASDDHDLKSNCLERNFYLFYNMYGMRITTRRYFSESWI